MEGGDAGQENDADAFGGDVTNNRANGKEEKRKEANDIDNDNMMWRNFHSDNDAMKNRQGEERDEKKRSAAAAAGEPAAATTHNVGTNSFLFQHYDDDDDDDGDEDEEEQEEKKNDNNKQKADQPSSSLAQSQEQEDNHRPHHASNNNISNNIPHHNTTHTHTRTVRPGAVAVRGIQGQGSFSSSSSFHEQQQRQQHQTLEEASPEQQQDDGETIPQARAVNGEPQEDNFDETREVIVQRELDRLQRGGQEAIRDMLGSDVAIGVAASSRVFPQRREEEPITPNKRVPPSSSLLCGRFDKEKTKSCIILFVIVAGVVGIVVGVVVGVTNKADCCDLSSPTTSSSDTAGEERQTYILSAVGNVTSPAVINDPNTPQHHALTWLLENETFDILEISKPKLLQRYILVTLYFATNGVGWNAQFNFLSAAVDDCLWNALDQEGNLMGVALCDEDECVSELTILENNMTGTLPGELGYLSALQALRFTNQDIGGTIPESITRLTSLSNLNLFEMNLTGSIPQDIGKLSQMDWLNLHGNKLTGPIPSSIGNVKVLNELFLYTNQLSGTLPGAIGNLQSLERLHLYDNRLSGTIPSSFSNLTNLKYALLEQNNFVDGMSALCGIAGLKSFSADCFTSLLGNVPPEVECCCCNYCYQDGDPEPNVNTMTC